MYVCIHACIYVCINVGISLYMYVLCMHVSVYVCMYHTYVHDACKHVMIFFYKITLFNFLNGLVRARIPLDPPLVRMHRGNCNLTMVDSNLKYVTGSGKSRLKSQMTKRQKFI